MQKVRRGHHPSPPPIGGRAFFLAQSDPNQDFVLRKPALVARIFMTAAKIFIHIYGIIIQ
jgi:hypothetical protein